MNFDINSNSNILQNNLKYNKPNENVISNNSEEGQAQIIGQPESEISIDNSTLSQSKYILSSLGLKISEENLKLIDSLVNNFLPITENNIKQLNQGIKLFNSDENSLNKSLFLLKNDLFPSSKISQQVNAYISEEIKISKQFENLFDEILFLDNPEKSKNIFLNLTNSIEKNNKNILPIFNNFKNIEKNIIENFSNNLELSENIKNLLINIDVQVNPNSNQQNNINTLNKSLINSLIKDFIKIPQTTNNDTIDFNGSSIFSLLKNDIKNILNLIDPKIKYNNSIDNTKPKEETSITTKNNNLQEITSKNKISNSKESFNEIINNPVFKNFPNLSKTISTFIVSNSTINKDYVIKDILKNLFKELENFKDDFSNLKNEYSSIKKFINKNTNFDIENNKNVANIKEFFKDKKEILSNIKTYIDEDIKSNNTLIKSIEDIDKNINFMNTLKNNTFLQIPININNYSTTAELYVFNNKKNNKSYNSKSYSSVLLSLNLAHLGHLETYITKNNNSIMCQFKIENDKIKNLISSNINTLNSYLQEKKLNLSNISFLTSDEHFSIISNEPSIFKESPSENINQNLDFKA